MNEARRLRLGILVAIASGGALSAATAGGCGSEVISEEANSGSVSASGTTASATGAAATAASTTGGGASAAASSGGAGGAASSSAVGAGGASPLCTDGPPAQGCYTLEQLEEMIENPPQGGDEPFDAGPGPDGGVTLTECPEPSLVLDGCCNPASAGPEEQGDLCCYLFCPGACCGRPFEIEGRARVAAVARRGDWSADAGAEPGAVDAATRGALAAAWLHDARMEHASIASFARFTLELLALGAPPDLIADSQRASLDEIEHARLCFALAARYGGAELGPGRLDVAGSGARGSLAESAAAAVREGCIGETIAALMAREQLARAQDPAVRAALARIAEDEERHAALSWRFVRWAIAEGGEAVRRAVEVAFEAGCGAAGAVTEEAPAPADAAAWSCHGRLGAGETLAVTRDALDQVIAPCARALLAPRPDATETA